MSVWAENLRVFRHKERHWEMKISWDGCVGSHAHRCFDFARATLLVHSLRGNFGDVRVWANGVASSVVRPFLKVFDRFLF